MNNHEVEQHTHDTTLSVIYSTDTNYIPHMAASMLSLMEHNTNIEAIKFYILDGGIEESDKAKVNSLCAKYDREVFFISVKEKLATACLATSFNLNAYGRLFAADYITEPVALYLDCDTIVAGSLKELASTDLEGYWAAGAQDTVSKEMRDIIGLQAEERYVNSGVLLMNLELWRKDKVEDKFRECIRQYNGNVPHNDQGIINAVCHEHMKILNIEYNANDTALFYKSEQLKMLFEMPTYYNDDDLKVAKQTPRIIHYTEAHYGRPWFSDCIHPYKDKYIQCRKLLTDKWVWNPQKGPPKKAVMRIVKIVLYHIIPFSLYTKLMIDKRRKKEQRIIQAVTIQPDDAK